VPVLASIIFFILFYVLSLLGEKWAKAGTLSVPAGIWMANAILFSIGFLFLLQARRDARLFESDFYMVIFDRIRRRFSKKPELIVSSGRL
jgi:lipopolysaccharide export system permease protein